MKAKLALVIAALALMLPVSSAQGAANSPNPAASCSGLISNFASQFGRDSGHVTADAAKTFQPLGQTFINAVAHEHLGSYTACVPA